MMTIDKLRQGVIVSTGPRADAIARIIQHPTNGLWMWEVNDGHPVTALEVGLRTEAEARAGLMQYLRVDPATEFEACDLIAARAIRACRLLVAAYTKGEDEGGHTDWEDIDTAHGAAELALGMAEQAGDEEAASNARLFAAAPALLKALKLVSMLDLEKLDPTNGTAARNIIAAAIAKATIAPAHFSIGEFQR
jgi:hypothetical protein